MSTPTEPTCINLAERFGDRYRISFDPAYDPKHRPREKLDPWYMVIPCERGEIYPQGGDVLVVEVEGRPRTRQRLASLDCTTVHQDGDDFAAFRFHVDDFDAIAEIMRPRKRRRLSEEQRRKNAERLREHQYQSRTSSAASGAEMDAGAKT